MYRWNLLNELGIDLQYNDLQLIPVLGYQQETSPITPLPINDFKVDFAPPGPLYQDFFGTPGNDTLVGTAGDDVFYPGGGSDTIDGADGYDLLNYSTFNGRVNVILFSMNQLVQTFDTNDVLSGTSSFSNIEGAITGDGNDTIFITVSSVFVGDFYMESGAGNDTLGMSSQNDNLTNLTMVAGDGDDFMRGGTGLDSFDGGTGSDRASTLNIVFGVSHQQVLMDLRINQITNDGFGNTETMLNVENISGGSYLVDTFHGNDLDNEIFGIAGGGDNLYGYDGDDVLFISEAGGVIDGGAGSDGLGFSGSRYVNIDEDSNGFFDREEIANGVSVNLSSGQILNDGFGGTGTFSSIENVSGTAQNDTLIGDGNDNEFNGGSAGDDTIDGGAGSDTLVLSGAQVTDYLIYDNGDGTLTVLDLVGTDGSDIVSGIELLKINGVDYDITTLISPFSPNADIYTGDATDETLSSFGGNDIVDGAGGNDTIDGGSGDDQLFGGSGNDTISSGGGVDTVDGGEGDDEILWMTSNNDFGYGETYDGGAGIDTLIISGQEFFSGSATLNLMTGTFSDSVGSTTLLNIENVNAVGFMGNQRFTLIGNSSSNVITLTSAAPNTDFADRIDGGAGDDVLTSYGGYVELVGGAGADTLSAGSGWVVVDYRSAPTSVSADLFVGTGSAGDALGDIFLGNFSAIYGSAFDDSLRGSSANSHSIRGGDGNDTIIGEGDFDFLYGEDGNDTIFGFGATSQLHGGVGDDVFHADDDFVFAGDGNDTLVFDSNDALPNSLAVTALGDAGNDTVLVIGYDFSGQIININTNGYQIPGTLTNIINFENYDASATSGSEQINGDSFDNVIRAGSGDNIINGNDGNDVLDGGAGADTLNGGSGNDTLGGGVGDDTIIGEAGNDVLWGGLGDDAMSGGADNDTYLVEQVGDTVTELAGEGNDIVYAFVDYTLSANVEIGVSLLTASTVSLSGNSQDNVLILSSTAGGNTVAGGAGNDTIYVQSNTTISGNAGNDIFVLQNFGNYVAGGTGDDVYIDLGSLNTIAEAVDGGVDTLYSYAADVTLGDNVEILVLLSADASVNATGNNAANTIIGTGADNIIAGLDGGDFLIGGGGNDTIAGGDGIDVLQGNSGADSFLYNTASEGNDFIQDWVAADDSFVFGATAFGFTAGETLIAGTNFISGNDPMAALAQATFLWDEDDTNLYYDADGSGAGEAVLIADLQAFTDVTVADFVFV